MQQLFHFTITINFCFVTKLEMVIQIGPQYTIIMREKAYKMENL